ncbi:MAG: hypothetical protein JNM27_06775 [Leptospirales bacterium]|nr:hypothetical protein [Leptospirales bacterium]
MNLVIRSLKSNPPLAFAVGYNALLVLILVPLAFFDQRLITGQPMWIKPVKFAISLVLYSGTIAVILNQLDRPRAVRIISWIVSISGLIEMVCIVGQVLRGVGSHFNQDTAFDGAVFSVMGISISVLWISHIWASVLLLKSKLADPVLLTGIRGGMLVSAFGMVIAFIMTMPGFDGPITMNSLGMPLATGHAVGAPENGPGFGIMGWSLLGGDLRVSHFVGLHAMQIVPLLAWALSGGGTHSTARAILSRNLVRGFSVSYAVVVATLLAQAMRGIPFNRIDSWTMNGYLIALGVLVVSLLPAIVMNKEKAIRS